MLQRFLVPNPAQGAEWKWTVPGEWQANLISVSAQLVAKANPTTLPDVGVNSFNATYNAARTQAIFGVTGPFGGGGGLAVDDGVSPPDVSIATAPNNGAFDTASFTVEFLLNVNMSGTNVFKRLFCLGDVLAPSIRFQVGMGSSGATITAQGLDAANNPFALGPGFANNSWHHVVVTNSAGTWQATVDNVAGTAVAGHNVGALTLATVNIGGGANGNQSYPGKIAAVAYWGSVLTGAQITNHFNAVATSAAAYKTAVLADTPLAFWLLSQLTTSFQRTATLVLTDGTKTIAKYPGFAPTQQASLFQWTWSVDGSGASQNTAQTVTIVPITPVTLPPGYTVGTSTLDLTTLDQWQNIVIWADVSPSGQPPGGIIGDGGYLNALLVPDYSHQGG